MRLKYLLHSCGIKSPERNRAVFSRLSSPVRPTEGAPDGGGDANSVKCHPHGHRRRMKLRALSPLSGQGSVCMCE